MNRTITAVNPFVLMTAPEVVLSMIEQSDELARLSSTICRPLDKPRVDPSSATLRRFDEAIDSAEIPEEPSAPE